MNNRENRKNRKTDFPPFPDWQSIISVVLQLYSKIEIKKQNGLASWLWLFQQCMYIKFSHFFFIFWSLLSFLITYGSIKSECNTYKWTSWVENRIVFCRFFLVHWRSFLGHNGLQMFLYGYFNPKEEQMFYLWCTY